MPIQTLSNGDVQQIIATTHRVLADSTLSPVIMTLADLCQQHQVRPEQGLMMLLKRSKQEEVEQTGPAVTDE
ncbi:hypothetical protein [Vibrio sp. TBV020]|uniref:hypothetical protein n=1 Tax=Vibrio sp. TBV020 TaxID=3137398 RepID=UPI0038CDC5FB